MTDNQAINIPREFWIPEDAKIVFVSDFFAEDYVGGAELTLEALYQASPVKAGKIHSTSLTHELIKKNSDKLWILVNFTLAKKEILSFFVTEKCKYVIVEMDYKYCKHRSEHYHKAQEGVECKCQDDMKQGKWIEAFYRRASSVYFMSDGQREVYISKFPKMSSWTNLKTQYSTWSKDDLDYLVELSFEHKSDNEEWAVLSGPSWIKNLKGTEEYCKQKGLAYKILPKLPYKEFLKELNKYKGLVFHPVGLDTCPRLVVEAKLLGLEIDINDFVQIKHEPWFMENDMEKFISFLYDRPKQFWQSINNQSLI